MPEKKRKVNQTFGTQNMTARRAGKGPVTTTQYTKPAPSNILSKLSKLSGGPPSTPQPISNAVPGRDGGLAIIEQLEVGPIDHKPPPDDPHFERLEPNSGIRLSYVSQLKLLDG